MDKFFIRKDVYDEIIKGMKDRSHLIQKVITDKNGHQKKVWVRPGEEPKKERIKNVETQTDDQRKTNPEIKSPEKKEIPVISVSDNFNENQEVSFNYGGNTLSGKITAKGKDGVTIHDKDDNIYKIHYNAIGKTLKNSDGTIPADSFNANDYKTQFTDKLATPNAEGTLHIYDELLNDKNYDSAVIEKAIDLTKKYLDLQSERIAKKGDTDQRFTGGKGIEHSQMYSLARQKLHDEILTNMFTPEKIKACQAAPGEQPKFIMFGGRGGSGKGWFTDKKRAEKGGYDVMFDSDKFLILDADEIKNLLPEFEGWNAGEVHEESSYLMKKAKKMAEYYKMNIIIDGTMNYSSKNPNKVRNEMLHFKEKGYRVEAHYMFLPVQESSKRAIMRFAHKNKNTGEYDYKGRLVPLNILLGMQDNEKSFDSVKDICDDWSFRDNNVPQGQLPKLISQKGK